MTKKILFIPLVVVIVFVLPTIIAFILPSNPTNYYNAYTAKLNRWKNLKQPRLILIGFSELAFGIDSEMIEDSTKYNVCNFGLHAGLGSDFVDRDAKGLVEKGDVVVYSFPLDMTNDGTADAQSILYIFDVCPKKIANLSFDNIKKSILGIYPFLKGKIEYNYREWSGLNAVNTDYNSNNFNSYGDESSHWSKNDIEGEVPFSIKCKSLQYFNEALYQQIVTTIQEMRQNGIIVIVIPQLLEKCNYGNNKVMSKYLEMRLNKDGIYYDIDPEDFLLEENQSYFGSHANRQGVTWCTNQIIYAIKNHKHTD